MIMGQSASLVGKTDKPCRSHARLTAGMLVCLVCWFSPVTYSLSETVFPATGTDFRSAEPAQLRLPAGSTRLDLGAHMQVQGLPLRAEIFETSASLRETSDMIASQPNAIPSLLVLPGSVLLAWQSGPHHWLVRLTQANASLTRGTVSVLTLAERDVPVLVRRHTESTWLPAQSRLLLAFDSIDRAHDAAGSRRVHQSVYTHDRPPSSLLPQIHARLRKTGWHRESHDPEHGEAGRWRRGAHTLMLLLVPVAGGSGMLLAESEPR